MGHTFRKVNINMKKEMNLGDVVRDIITGFEGIITSKCDYITGCTHFGIAPTELKDGRPQDSYYLDEQRLIFVKKSELSESSIRKGGPQRDPIAINHPSF